MTKQTIIDCYTKLGELVAKEYELQDQIITLTKAQKLAHNERLLWEAKIDNKEWEDLIVNKK